MAIQSPYSDKSVLILDDLPEMRSSLRSQIGTLGCNKVAMSSNVKDALDQVGRAHFDIILCDFYLSGGTDGQQFLEFLRTNNLIRRATIFMMVTAEKGYENVVTVAECLPDDYLLKPFTADLLKVRMERLLERKSRLVKVDAMQDKENWPEVINACDEIIAAKDRYLVDAMRIKGHAMLLAGRAEAAVTFYEQIIEMRPMPWAKLGLARALFQVGHVTRCRETLIDLIAESPKLMAAYDLLGQLQMASGDVNAALSTLDNACQISPNSLARHRAIATVAEETGDFVRVEQALAQVVKRTRNSPLRDTIDFVRLGNALTEMGAPEKAAALLEEVRSTFKADANHPQLAAVEAVAQHRAGNPEKAAAALARAMQNDLSKQPEAVAIVVAKACLKTGKHGEAEGILKHMVQSQPEANDLHERISAVLREHGAHELAEQLVSNSIAEIIHFNNEAVRRAKTGELALAAEMLTEAAHRLPGNMQVVSNAAAALLFDVFTNGLNPDKLRTAQAFQQAVVAHSPNHPKLQEIAELMGHIRTKYATVKK